MMIIRVEKGKEKSTEKVAEEVVVVEREEM